MAHSEDPSTSSPKNRPLITLTLSHPEHPAQDVNKQWFHQRTLVFSASMSFGYVSGATTHGSADWRPSPTNLVFDQELVGHSNIKTHAVLGFTEDKNGITICDWLSAHGTFVNGKNIQKRKSPFLSYELHDGDIITLGRQVKAHGVIFEGIKLRVGIKHHHRIITPSPLSMPVKRELHTTKSANDGLQSNVEPVARLDKNLNPGGKRKRTDRYIKKEEFDGDGPTDTAPTADKRPRNTLDLQASSHSSSASTIGVDSHSSVTVVDSDDNSLARHSKMDTILELIRSAETKKAVCTKDLEDATKRHRDETERYTKEKQRFQSEKKVLEEKKEKEDKTIQELWRRAAEICQLAQHS